MQLTSLPFFVFFAAVFALYWALGPRFRTPLLFVASMGFYAGFGAEYLVLLFACCVICFAAARRLAACPARWRLALYLVLALLPLLLFKYFDFTSLLIAKIAGAVGFSFSPVLLRLAQPAGISYYTFQMVSYLTDVYRKKQPPEQNFFVCALCLSFFPQITAGPLTRPRDLAPQYRQQKQFDSARALAAGRLIVLGLYKKLVVADTLGYYTDQVFADAGRLSSGSLLFIVFSYTIRIYADFSGYTDVARGTAALLGIDLAENFRTPYLSVSIKQFWSRWHMSLSGWLQEYVYIPLGGSRVSRPRHWLNLLVTFLVSGLWHGASLTMVAWGLLHGVYLVVGDMTRRGRERVCRAVGLSRDKLPGRVLSTLITFCLVAFAWIFFASPDMGQAVYIATHLFSDLSPTVQYAKNSIALLGLGGRALVRQCWCIGSMVGMDLIGGSEGFDRKLAAAPAAVRWGVCTAALAAVVLCGSLTDSTAMYFNF